VRRFICVTYIGCKKYQNIIKAQDVDIIFKTATMTITNHQDEQRAAATRIKAASHFRLQGG
jgi:hypothetical protein